MASEQSATSGMKWYQRLGPGLITACVVIGPGSILLSSKVGAEHGYSMLWVIAVSVVFMIVYMSLGAKLGVVADCAPAELVTKRAGRWLAVLIGISVFFISASFQFGNNLGVHSAFKVYVKDFDYFIVIFNAVTIAFLFGFRNLYVAIERLMMAFVALMLISFAANLAFAQPSLPELFAGLIPPVGDLFDPNKESPFSLSLLGLVGTTFVISAAYYQAYLVRQKGWGVSELKSGLIDARVGAMIMFLITLMLMATAAAVLKEPPSSVGDVAVGLKPLFGEKGQALFCLGLFSAAYSSFMVNSMIGGFILSDGLGVGSKPTDLWPKIFTAVVLLTGMGVALFVIKWKIDALPAIVAAQAVTVLAAPLLAGVLWWLTSSKDIMGEQRNGPVMNILAGLGFVLLLGMAYYTATVKVWPEVSKWLELG